MMTINLKNLAQAAWPVALVIALASAPVSADTVSSNKSAMSTLTQYDLTAKAGSTSTQVQIDKAARKAAKQAAKKARKCAKWKSKMHRSNKARGKYNASCLSSSTITTDIEASDSSDSGDTSDGTTGDTDTGGIDQGSFVAEVTTESVPEPGTLALLGLGLMGLGMSRRKAK